MEKLTNAQAIKRYFEKDGGRPVTMPELKALTKDERDWFGQEACKALGVEYQAS